MIGWVSQLPRTETVSLIIFGLVVLGFIVAAWLAWLEERAADRSKLLRQITYVETKDGELGSPI